MILNQIVSSDCVRLICLWFALNLILFQVAHTNITSGTQMYVNSLARERYPINYIFGFSSEGFSYFLTTQMEESSPSPFETKLVRVCQGDPDYYSYTEVPLVCNSKTKGYALAQVSTF